MTTTYSKFGLITALASITLLVGCSSQPTKTMPTQTVVVSQPNDDTLECHQLETNLNTIEHQIADMLTLKQQRSKKTFALTTIVDMTIAILSGVGTRVERSSLAEFSKPEKARINSLAQRHNHLLLLSKKKQCSFVPKVEKSMEKISAEINPEKPETTSVRRRTNQY